MHKREAIRLVREELAKGSDISEATIIAVISFNKEASERIGKVSASTKSQVEICPFKIPTPLAQW
jgi:hypothetical protein